jgi:hypothetical protein
MAVIAGMQSKSQTTALQQDTILVLLEASDDSGRTLMMLDQASTIIPEPINTRCANPALQELPCLCVDRNDQLLPDTRKSGGINHSWIFTASR